MNRKTIIIYVQKLFTLFLTILIFFTPFSIIAYAAGEIIIDGQIDDWKDSKPLEMTMEQTSNDLSLTIRNIFLKNTDQNMYIAIQMQAKPNTYASYFADIDADTNGLSDFTIAYLPNKNRNPAYIHDISICDSKIEGQDNCRDFAYGNSKLDSIIELEIPFDKLPVKLNNNYNIRFRIYDNQNQKYVTRTIFSSTVEDGLVAEWHFDESSGNILRDTSGNANDGTIYGATWTTGKFGSALQFDGTDDYVEVPDSPELSGGVGKDKTIEFWFKSNKPSGHIITKWQDISYKDWGIFMGSWINGPPNLGFYYEKDNPNNDMRFYGGTIQQNVWNHGAFTFEAENPRGANNAKLTIYLNGEKLNLNFWNDHPPYTVSPDQLYDMHDTTAPVSIGYSGRYYNSGYFSGLIDEIKIYSKVLSANEIKAEFEKGGIGGPIPIITTPKVGDGGNVPILEIIKHNVIFEGTFNQFNYGTYPMSMEITFVDGLDFNGILHWTSLGDSKTKFRGKIDSILNQISFTEYEQIQGSAPIVLNGNYYAELQDNTLNGYWNWPNGGKGGTFSITSTSSSTPTLTPTLLPGKITGISISPENPIYREQYTVTLNIKNPNSVEQDYKIGLKEDGFTKCSPSISLIHTIQPGETTSYSFKCKTSWEWIPPGHEGLGEIGKGVIEGVKLLGWVTLEKAIKNKRWGAAWDSFITILETTHTLSQIKAINYYDVALSSKSTPEIIIDPGVNQNIAIEVPLWFKKMFLVESALLTLGAQGVDVVPGAGPLYGALVKVMAYDLYRQAYDPDFNYMTIQEPVPMYLPELDSVPDGDGKKFALATADLASLRHATFIAYIRYDGAMTDNQPDYMLMQLEAANNYTVQAIQKIHEVEKYYKLSTASMEPLRDEQIQQFREDIRTNGLPQVEIDILTRNGLGNSIEDITQMVLNTNTEVYRNPKNYTRFLDLQATMLASETSAYTSEIIRIKVEDKGYGVTIAPDSDISYLEDLKSQIQLSIEKGMATSDVRAQMNEMISKSSEVLEETNNLAYQPYYEFAVDALASFHTLDNTPPQITEVDNINELMLLIIIILVIFLLGLTIKVRIQRSRKREINESVKNNDRSEIMEEDTEIKNFVTKTAQSYAYNLRIVLSNKEKTDTLLANLEELKSKGEVDEQQYERMKKEYSGKVNTATGEVETIRRSIRSELDELEKDITAYSKERNDLNVRLQVGELTEEGVGEQIDDLENKVEGAEEEKSELEKLLQVEKSEILDEYIDINVRKKPDSSVLERNYPPESTGRITHTDNDFQKRPTVISATYGALSAFIVGMILSYILLQVGVGSMMSSSGNNPLAGLGAGLAKGVIDSNSFQITGMIYYFAHGISFEAGALGSSQSMNIFMVMEQGRTSEPWLLFLLPFLGLFSGGYISAKIAGVRGMNLGFRSGAYVALPYMVIMVLASSMFSLNIILASINIDIPTTIFFALIFGVIFGGIGGAFKGIKGR